MKNIYYSLIAILCLFVVVSCSDDSPTGTDDTGGDGSSITMYQLVVSSDPGEGGSVSPGSDEYEEGTSVEITATPNDDWVFTEWTGDHTGTSNPVSVTMDSDKDITALFIKREYPLTVNIEGEGTVGERVVQEKTTDYEAGTTVELTANPADGWVFVEWQGDIEGDQNPETITIDQATEVTAVFERKDYPLTVNIEGEGSVDEEVVQAKTTDYPYETNVELTANAEEGWKFVEWQGDLEGDDNPQQIVVDEAKEVTALFEQKNFNLTIEIQGEGNVEQEEIQSKTTEYGSGTQVKLTAMSEDDWRFVGWKEDATGTENEITVTIDHHKTIIATFDDSDFEGGDGSEKYPYEVATVEQLQDIRNYTDRHFIQVNDIDASGTESWNGGQGFRPIGDEIVRFKGRYDGNNNSISNIFIERKNEEDVGIFGYAENAIIKNILIDAQITGGGRVGGLVGVIYDSMIINVHITSEVSVDEVNSNVGGLIGAMFRTEIKSSSSSGTVVGSSRAGGLAGYNSGGSVDKSYSNSAISGDISAGGLIGSNNFNGSITNSYATGDVKSSRDINSGRTGGLVAQNWDSSIINSYATGDVSGASNMVGGFVGNNRGNIHNSFSEGDVSGEKDMVGGFVGRNSENSMVLDSYSAGNVVGINQVGGFAGINRDDAEIKRSFSVGKVTGQQDVGGFSGVNGAFIESSFFDIVTSNQSNAVGRGSSDGTTGLNTSEMQGASAEDNMPEFDWDEIWMTVSGDYPILRWQQ